MSPSFLPASAVARLAAVLPAPTVEALLANARAFAAWVAGPALRAHTPEAAVQHVLTSVGTAAQLKSELVEALRHVPDGMQLYTEALASAPALIEDDHFPALASALDALVRTQRVWSRLVRFHRGPGRPLDDAEAVALNEALTLAFHADNLTAVCMLVVAEEAVASDVLAALLCAADDYAARALQAARHVAELLAPAVPMGRRARTTVADLLALPPFDGDALTARQIAEAAAPGSPST